MTQGRPTAAVGHMPFVGHRTCALNELDRNEMRDIAKAMRPDWSEQQFQAKWDEFQAQKRRRAMS